MVLKCICCNSFAISESVSRPMHKKIFVLFNIMFNRFSQASREKADWNIGNKEASWLKMSTQIRHLFTAAVASTTKNLREQDEDSDWQLWPKNRGNIQREDRAWNLLWEEATRHGRVLPAEGAAGLTKEKNPQLNPSIIYLRFQEIQHSHVHSEVEVFYRLLFEQICIFVDILKTAQISIRLYSFTEPRKQHMEIKKEFNTENTFLMYFHHRSVDLC